MYYIRNIININFYCENSWGGGERNRFGEGDIPGSPPPVWDPASLWLVAVAAHSSMAKSAPSSLPMSMCRKHKDAVLNYPIMIWI